MEWSAVTYDVAVAFNSRRAGKSKVLSETALPYRTLVLVLPLVAWEVNLKSEESQSDGSNCGAPLASPEIYIIISSTYYPILQSKIMSRIGASG
jgi:hypothetical protein